MKAERTEEIPGDIAHCMGCGEPWKVGDKVMVISQIPITITRIGPDDDPHADSREGVEAVRAWHADCLR